MNSICSRKLLDEYNERCLLFSLDTETCGFKYKIDKDNNYILVKYVGEDTEIFLGDMFDIIEVGAFENTNVVKIDFGITKHIGNRVCLNCQKLEFIKALECVMVGIDSFRDCYSLKQAVFGKLQYIGSSSFFNCNHLISIDGLDNLRVIKQRAFNLCISLKEISLGSQLKELPKNAFKYCYDLEKINTENIEIISKHALGCCQTLKYLNLSNVTRIESVGFYGAICVETIVLGSSYHNKYVSYLKDLTSLKKIIFKGEESELSFLRNNLMNCGLDYVEIIKE